MTDTTSFEFLNQQPLKQLVGTESAKDAVARVTYTHDAMIDVLLANPAISQNSLAAHFGFSVGWVSRVKNSDAFLHRLAERKRELTDPTIAAGIEEKFRALVDTSLDILQEKLSTVRSPDLALKALSEGSKALGYGARAANVNVQQNFVVALPGKSQDAATWAAGYNRAPAADVIEQ